MGWPVSQGAGAAGAFALRSGYALPAANAPAAAKKSPSSPRPDRRPPFVLSCAANLHGRADAQSAGRRAPASTRQCSYGALPLRVRRRALFAACLLARALRRLTTRLPCAGLFRTLSNSLPVSSLPRTRFVFARTRSSTPGSRSRRSTNSEVRLPGRRPPARRRVQKQLRCCPEGPERYDFFFSRGLFFSAPGCGARRPQNPQRQPLRVDRGVQVQASGAGVVPRFPNPRSSPASRSSARCRPARTAPSSPPARSVCRRLQDVLHRHRITVRLVDQASLCSSRSARERLRRRFRLVPSHQELVPACRSTKVSRRAVAVARLEIVSHPANHAAQDMRGYGTRRRAGPENATGTRPGANKRAFLRRSSLGRGTCAPTPRTRQASPPPHRN